MFRPEPRHAGSSAPSNSDRAASQQIVPVSAAIVGLLPILYFSCDLIIGQLAL